MAFMFAVFGSARAFWSFSWESIVGVVKALGQRRTNRRQEGLSLTLYMNLKRHLATLFDPYSTPPGYFRFDARVVAQDMRARWEGRRWTWTDEESRDIVAVVPTCTVDARAGEAAATEVIVAGQRVRVSTIVMTTFHYLEILDVRLTWKKHLLGSREPVFLSKPEVKLTGRLLYADSIVVSPQLDCQWKRFGVLREHSSLTCSASLTHFISTVEVMDVAHLTDREHSGRPSDRVIVCDHA